LPTYHTIGAAPLLWAMRWPAGLGGEWGGAVPGDRKRLRKRAWYGMFPQLGAHWFFLPAAFLCSRWLTDKQFFASAGASVSGERVLVFLGLYVRLTITETPVPGSASTEGASESAMLVVFS